MLERRQKTRRRVCWQGSVTAGLTDPILSVHIRDMSETGAKIRLPKGVLPGREIAFRVERTGDIRQAEVIWRSMEHYGLRFHPAYEATGEDETPGEPLGDWLADRPFS
ncbi:PilZ domain-containing protein [Aureimonas sp. AU20]|uniref:PilZ domain-containing protein n=1 Tax=Aureimonas sp. AU20 TaxID=1349819 RepID=UPI00071ED83D|nr:PilZ domain-containing protein [Aureimonas sp. AU20]ALN71464.1 hypothetical protein M673_02000 [Aureimonas sp. AU20]